MVLPIFCALYYNLLEKSQDVGYKKFWPALQLVMGVVNKYYDFTSHALTTATVLDPRAKLEFFEPFVGKAGHESLRVLEAWVRAELKPYTDVQAVDSQQSSSSEAVAGGRLMLYFGAPKKEVRDVDELSIYLAEARVPDDQMSLPLVEDECMQIP